MNNNQMDEQMDYSGLSEAELSAISISYQNSLMKTDNPTYPYCSAAFQTFIEEMVAITKIRPDLAIKMIKELSALVLALGRVTGATTTHPDQIAKSLTTEELKWQLVNSIGTTFLSQQLTNLMTQMLAAIEPHIHFPNKNNTKH